MPVNRRFILSLVGTAALTPALGAVRPALAADELRTDRSVGSPDAKVTVEEFFSLTCTHCAAFSRETLPQLRAKFIDAGKVRWVFRDFPLDQVALTAAMVARYLPAERYEPFVNALFASQDRWAFARGVNNNDELWKTAALAGMGRSTFDQAVGDTDLRNWILQQQAEFQKRWNIDSTPSFVINGQKYSGEMSFEAFSKLIPTT